jgi:hypothetical protein
MASIGIIHQSQTISDVMIIVRVFFLMHWLLFSCIQLLPVMRCVTGMVSHFFIARCNLISTLLLEKC